MYIVTILRVEKWTVVGGPLFNSSYIIMDGFAALDANDTLVKDQVIWTFLVLSDVKLHMTSPILNVEVEYLINLCGEWRAGE